MGHLFEHNSAESFENFEPYQDDSSEVGQIHLKPKLSSNMPTLIWRHVSNTSCVQGFEMK